MVMVSPDFKRLKTFFPEGDGIPNHGLALQRPELDNALLKLASEQGATIRMGARPQRIERADGQWNATLADGEPIQARLLIGADGRKSSTARLLGLTLPARRSRTAIHIDRPARIPAPPFGQMHVFDDGAYMGLNAITPDTVNVSMVCDPDALRGLPVVDFINDHIRRSPHLSELIELLPTGARPVATYPANAQARSAATHDAALVGDASGYIDPLTGEGIFAAFWTAEALVCAIREGWRELPAALQRYADRRRRQQLAKASLCELFQVFIGRPWLANSIYWLLSRRQAVADSFIGIVGNSYSPARGLARMARHALAF
jgi:2-polyprenyl-6-methoxyphenol hydroxylase-like FAD-dependent oxidoreductase